MGACLLIGIGNGYRRDDGVGLYIVRQLGKLPGVEILESSGEGTGLMDAWGGAEMVLVFDAVASDAPAGTVHRLDACSGTVRADFFACSTHAFGLAEAVETARALGELPPRLVIYGVEGADFSPGVGLTPEVEKATERVIERVIDEFTLAYP